MPFKDSEHLGCLPSVLKPRVSKRLVDHYASNFKASYPPFWKAFR